MPGKIRERQHRLPSTLYQGYVSVAFTCCVKGHIAIFNDKEVFDIFSDTLLTEASRHYCNVVAYIFMLDHCHILLQGKSETADTLRAIYLFKQRTGFWFSQHMKNVHWQKDFYDHILNKDDEIDKQVRYILDNPVRKVIVDDWQAYPWKGSSKFDMNQWEG
jgi:REP element-mobilizing transposase RayT